MKILLDRTEETICHTLGIEGYDEAPVLTLRWNADT